MQEWSSTRVEKDDIPAPRRAREAREQHAVTLADHRIHAEAGHLNPERSAGAHDPPHEIDETLGGENPGRHGPRRVNETA
jgi:hypothetical protein